MAEKNFLTRITINKYQNKNSIGIADLLTGKLPGFSSNLLTIFYNFFENHVANEEEIEELAKIEQKKGSNYFFKVIDLKLNKKEEFICGKIVFSNFEELLKSILADRNGKKEKANNLKFIPRRTLFFMMKFPKIRKNNELGLLFLQKIGSHSIFAILKDKIINYFNDKNLSFEHFTFKDEYEQLKNCETQSIKYIKKRFASDVDDIKDLKTMGVNNVIQNTILNFVKKPLFEKIQEHAIKFEKSPFLLSSEGSELEVSVKLNGVTKKFQLSEGNYKSIPDNIVIDDNIDYNVKNEVVWKSVENIFLEEMNRCCSQIKIDNWNDKKGD